ncbi:MAG: HNH endonuclease [Candidatus Bathyarchaeota archaeon]|nr:HNH endonuclease [Candidatus Bathyarchaeota archaeon]
MTIQCILCSRYESKTRKVEGKLVYNLEKKLIGFEHAYASKGVCPECVRHFLGHIPKNNQPVLLEFKVDNKPIWFLSKPIKFFKSTGHSSNGCFNFSFDWLRKIYKLNRTKRVDLPVSVIKHLPKKCEECGKETNLEIHHKIPLCFGGSNKVGNLQVLCKECHLNAGLQYPSSVTFDFQNLLREILEEEYKTKIDCYKAVQKGYN